MCACVCMQRRQSGLKSGGRRSGKKKSIFPGKFPKSSLFSVKFTKKFRFFEANFRKISIFQTTEEQNSNFQAKIGHLHCTATSWQIILFLFKSHHFRTYSLYTIRYNNISRPVHDIHDLPATPHNPSAQ